MRVITGKYKGRKLEAPADMGVRPTTDKVKEALFDILMGDIDGSVFCDLFSGSGAIGIEALSRGADRCWLCDADRSSIRLIKTNLKTCGIGDEAKVLTCDYKKALRKITDKVDIFFIDPPYESGVYESCLSQIEILDLLSDVGIIITEHDSRTEMPENVGDIERVRDHRYGKTVLSVYRKTEPGRTE